MKKENLHLVDMIENEDGVPSMCAIRPISKHRYVKQSSEEILVDKGGIERRDEISDIKRGKDSVGSHALEEVQEIKAVGSILDGPEKVGQNRTVKQKMSSFVEVIDVCTGLQECTCDISIQELEILKDNHPENMHHVKLMQFESNTKPFSADGMRSKFEDIKFNDSLSVKNVGCHVEDEKCQHCKEPSIYDLTKVRRTCHELEKKKMLAQLGGRNQNYRSRLALEINRVHGSSSSKLGESVITHTSSTQLYDAINFYNSVNKKQEMKEANLVDGNIVTGISSGSNKSVNFKKIPWLITLSKHRKAAGKKRSENITNNFRRVEEIQNQPQIKMSQSTAIKISYCTYDQAMNQRVAIKRKVKLQNNHEHLMLETDRAYVSSSKSGASMKNHINDTNSSNFINFRHSVNKKQEIEGAKQAVSATAKEASSKCSRSIAPKRFQRLYSLSKHRQADGKKRRTDIDVACRKAKEISDRPQIKISLTRAIEISNRLYGRSMKQRVALRTKTLI